MRKASRIQENSPQIQLGICPISEMTFAPQSRDSVTRLLTGLQHVYLDEVCREEIINEIRLMVNNGKMGGRERKRRFRLLEPLAKLFHNEVK